MAGDKNDSARRSTLSRWAVAFCCWTLLIWGHSLVQGPQSSAESGMVVELVRPLFEALGVSDVDLMTLVVRKGAHFAEYAVLGVLAWGTLRARLRERGHAPFPAALLVALVPVCDEAIQLLVPGRSGQLGDVLLDLSGVCCGVLLAVLLSAFVRRRV